MLLSLLLHGAVAAPYLTWAMQEPVEVPGDEGPEDAPVGDGGNGKPVAAPMLAPSVPVSISMYVEPTPAPATESPPAKSAPTQTSSGSSNSSAGSSSSSNQSTDPRVNREWGDGSASNDQGSGGSSPGNKSSCDPHEDITKIGTQHWRVNRDLVDYYASHLRELDRQASTATHRGPDGKPDGFRVYLPRCSILRQGGLRNGDVVHTVNGHKVTNVANAVTTYLKVRKQRDIEVEITRKSGKKVTLRYRLK